MSGYKRPSFDEDWWQKVEDFLRENPSVGFEPEDAKQFIKFATNRKIQNIKEDLEDMEKLQDELGSN